MSNSEEEDYIPFHDRSEWKDVKPVHQDDGPNPICLINYSEEFRDTMDYFRAIIQSGEKSDRALRLTDEVIRINAANYTAWYYRRVLLEALKSDLKKELESSEKATMENSKNYQIWYHRRWIVEKLEDPSHEKILTNLLFDEDSKNYHAWSHRQWCVERFGLWEGELDFTQRFIKRDVRNNSAWNHRFWIISNSEHKWSSDVVNSEIEFSISQIRTAPNNQSAWNYLKGVVNGHFKDLPQIEQFCREALERYPTCLHAASLLVDILQDKIAAGDAIADVVEAKQAVVQEAVKMCETLGNQLDQIRSKYWEYRTSCIQNA